MKIEYSEELSINDLLHDLARLEKKQEEGPRRCREILKKKQNTQRPYLSNTELIALSGLDAKTIDNYLGNNDRKERRVTWRPLLKLCLCFDFTSAEILKILEMGGVALDTLEISRTDKNIIHVLLQKRDKQDTKMNPLEFNYYFVQMGGKSMRKED